MARNKIRIGTVSGAFLAVALTISSCAAPQFTYVSDGTAGAYFKVPYGWHQISSDSLSPLLTAQSGPFSNAPGSWHAAYDGDGAPSATHLLSSVTIQPFVYAYVAPLTRDVSNAMSYNALRDFILPVTAPDRQAAAATKVFPLTGFRLLRDTVLTTKQGVHGVWDTFDYTYPGNVTDTIDQVALANADNTEVYVLMMHCVASCYLQNQAEFNTIMSSFTVRSP